MSIIPPAVLTVAQLVSSVVATAKNARELAKDSHNHELKAAISDLYDDILDVKGRVLDLDEENRKLRAEVERKDEIVGPKSPPGFFYYRSKPDDPLCPKCWQVHGKKNAVFLKAQELWGQLGYICIICNGQFLESGE